MELSAALQSVGVVVRGLDSSFTGTFLNLVQKEKATVSSDDSAHAIFFLQLINPVSVMEVRGE